MLILQEPRIPASTAAGPGFSDGEIYVVFCLGENDLVSSWESWTVGSLLWSEAQQSCQIPINPNKRQLCVCISALKSDTLKLLEVFLEVLCWYLPHIQGVGVMHLENTGPLVFMHIFIQEIWGRNTVTLFQQSPPSLGQLSLSHPTVAKR